MHRYALYFVPAPGSRLAEFGNRWLGRDVWTGAEFPPPVHRNISAEDHRNATATAASYGFHGTLKPPFRLSDGSDAETLCEQLAAFADTRAPVAAPPFVLADLDGFLALVLSAASPALRELAADCVRGFDPFRRPPTTEELARRRQHGLTSRQESYLLRWGYPYVMEEFRFHLTLTGRLEEARRRQFKGALGPLANPLCRDGLLIDAVTLCGQEKPEAPFRAIERFEFLG